MHLESDSPPTRHEIQLIGAERQIPCRSDQDVLNATIRAGVPWLRIGCRGGGCGVCRVIVRSGDFRAGRVSKRLVEGCDGPGRYALACRTYPLTDLTIELAPIGVPTAPSPSNQTGGTHGN